MQVLLALVIAHLVGDFVVQRKAVIDGKCAGRSWAFAEHGAWHLACLVVAWLLFAPAGIAAWQLAIAFGGIVVLHLLTDFAKYRWMADRALPAFVVDQAIHLAVLAVAAWWLAGRPDWWQAIEAFWQPLAFRAGWLAVAYLVVVVVFGWLNRLLLQSLLPEPDEESEQQRLGLARAGLYIGWLERFLMFSAVLIDAWSVLGLVLAAKSVFRFDSIRHRRRHTEYFVIGTLLSVSEVVAVGLALRWLMPDITGGF